MPTQPSPPNILFIIADDHRFDAIRALGNAEVITPNLDRLVSQGTTLTHTYIMGSTSDAVCMPSRGMLLTGRSLFRIEAPHLGDYPLWPERLRQAGYTTYGVGKWHNEPPSYARSFSGGDKIFFGGMSDHDKVPIWAFDPSGAYPPAAPSLGEKFSSDLFSDAAVNFLHNHPNDRPFCLYLAFTAPHDPRTPPAEYAELYDPDKITLPENFLLEHPFDNGEMRVRDEKLAAWPRTPAEIRQHIADYYGMITHLDAQIGRVLAALQKTGQADNTLVVYTADHGLAVGQHGLLGKQNLYDHSIRVPLIVKGPGIPQNERRDGLCYLYDLYPTLCELTGVPIPDTVEGQSLMPLITGRQPAHRDTIFSAYQQVQRMVRDRSYKLIEYFVDDNRRSQLFDLSDDPNETRDLSTEAHHTTRLVEFRQKLEAWQQAVDDPLLLTQR